MDDDTVLVAICRYQIEPVSSSSCSENMTACLRFTRRVSLVYVLRATSTLTLRPGLEVLCR